MPLNLKVIDQHVKYVREDDVKFKGHKNLPLHNQWIYFCTQTHHAVGVHVGVQRTAVFSLEDER